MYENYQITEIDIKNKILNVLKCEYITDIKKANPNGNTKNKKKNLHVNDDILNNHIGFADIIVWFYNKNCQYILNDAKQIWNILSKNPLEKCNIIDFLNAYTNEIIDKHKKYYTNLCKYKKLAKIVKNTYELLESLDRFIQNLPMEIINNEVNTDQKQDISIRDNICFNIILDSVENYDLDSIFQNPDFIGHHIEFGYKDYIVSSPIEITKGNKIQFTLTKLDFDFRLQNGSIYINLYEDFCKNGQQYKVLVAARNLDLFTNVNHKFLNNLIHRHNAEVNPDNHKNLTTEDIAYDTYYLKKVTRVRYNNGLRVEEYGSNDIRGKYSNLETIMANDSYTTATNMQKDNNLEDYVKLNMSIHVDSSSIQNDLMMFKKIGMIRGQYLEGKMKNYRIESSSYQKKLSLLISPFDNLLKFNEKFMYVVTSERKLKKCTNGCKIF